MAAASLLEQQQQQQQQQYGSSTDGQVQLQQQQQQQQQQQATYSAARARRRPARYSPELSAAQQQHQSALADMGLSTGAQDTTTAALQAQGGGAADGPTSELERDDAEEALLTPAGEMAPAVAAAALVARRSSKHRTKRKYKRKQTNAQLQHQQHQAEDVAAAGKRPRVANVLLENEILIDEIRVRKALWMRTHEQHHSSLLTAPLWEEIAKALDTTQENIRRRWKSLKDHYRRELKKSMTDPTAPPSTWPYYKKMRFMKSQMFVSLRRKNGEDHLEILSDDEEDINNGQWNGQVARKQENDSDTMDDYELADYNELVKYEQHLQQLDPEETMDGAEEEEEQEEDDQQQQQQDEQEEQEEQNEMSPIPSLQDQEDQHQLTALQQQAAELSELSNMSRLQQQPVITSDISTMTTLTDINGIPAAIVTTTASSLANAIQQQHRVSELTDHRLQRQQQQREHHLQRRSQELDDNLAEMNARHTALEQQRAEINGRLSAIQRNAEMTAMQQRASITAMHERAEMTAMQQRAELAAQRNGVDSGVNGSGVVIDDDRGGISDDYHFFMSLMPHVRHFTSLQKLKVRNRIQQIIIEEASNGAQYDPLGNC